MDRRDADRAATFPEATPILDSNFWRALPISNKVLNCLSAISLLQCLVFYGSGKLGHFFYDFSMLLIIFRQLICLASTIHNLNPHIGSVISIIWKSSYFHYAFSTFSIYSTSDQPVIYALAVFIIESIVAIRVVDSEVKSIAPQYENAVHYLSKVILGSAQFQQLRASLEIALIPSLLAKAFANFSPKMLFCCTVYIFVDAMYLYVFDQMHQALWGQLNSFANGLQKLSPDILASFIKSIQQMVMTFGKMADSIYSSQNRYKTD